MELYKIKKIYGEQKMYIITSFKGFRKLLPVIIGFFLFSACAPVTIEIHQSPPPIPPETGESAQIPATSFPTEMPSSSLSETAAIQTDPPPSANTETAATYGVLSLVVPPGVASGSSGREMPPFDSDDAAWWQKTPGHLEISLGDYYALQGKFHLPQISVYPAQAYAEMVPTAFESIRRLNNIQYGSTVPIGAEQLPAIPFFNAQPVFAANIEVISFQNGGGIRFLTQYAQYPAPANNHELFYHFQGVTRDGAYYVIAIFPVKASELAETSESAADLLIGGVAYPDMSDPNADWAGYYAAVTDLLNATPGDSFTPQLGQLDALVNSIVIATP
jgi:hypothetical protein